MMTLKKMFTLRNIVILVVVLYVFRMFFGQGEGFCGCLGPGNGECSEFAKAKCGVSHDEISDCWLPRYLMCAASCTGGPDKCNCHKYASRYCGGLDVDCQAAKCYADAHQGCMAAQGQSPPTSCKYDYVW